MSDAHLSGRDLLARSTELRLQLGLLARAGAQLLGDGVLAALAEHPALERSRALAGRVACIRCGPRHILQSGDQLGLAVDPRRERVLLAVAEHVLDAPRDLRRALGRFANAGQPGDAIAVARRVTRI